MSIRLVVGLGNPGDAYLDTPHNIGFKFINALVKASSTDVVKKKKLKSQVYHLTLQGHALIAIKPQTFMNLSGEAVVAVMNYYKLTPNEICIVTDDLDIEFGRVRMRLKGGAGTHNGMKSVLQQLGTSQVARLRLGIGPKPEGIDLSAFVLNPFHSNRQLELPLFLSLLVDHFGGALNESMDVMMHRLNSIQIADNNLGSNKS